MNVNVFAKRLIADVFYYAAFTEHISLVSD